VDKYGTSKTLRTERPYLKVRTKFYKDRCNVVLLLFWLSLLLENGAYASRFCFKASYFFVTCLIADIT